MNPSRSPRLYLAAVCAAQHDPLPPADLARPSSPALEAHATVTAVESDSTISVVFTTAA
jgi:hypothetical protein